MKEIKDLIALFNQERALTEERHDLMKQQVRIHEQTIADLKRRLECAERENLRLTREAMGAEA